MAPVRLDLLGGFQLTATGGTPVSLTSRKARAVLACLALAQGRAQSRDKLAALCWADSNAGQARSSLRQALSAVRRALEEAGQRVVLAEGDCVTLGEIAVDVHEFAQCAADGTPDALERAMALYRGDLLEGFHAAAPAFDHWLAVERERLRGMALASMSRLLAHHEQAGATDRAVACATRLLALDPLQEGVHRSLMRAYAQQGRQALALRQYRLCRTALLRELGVSPEAETEALYQSILRARRQPSPGTSGVEGSDGSDDLAGLPAPPAPFDAEPELRHAVVLVASLDDTGGLEPERLHEALALWRQRARQLACACGGLTLDEIGARLTVVFGVPVAHGNDAERALHTAGALHAELARLGDATGARLLARVGLASGQLLAACGGSGITMTGGPVSVALQAMAQAEPGTTVVSNRIWQALPGRLEAEGAGHATLPGVPDAIPLWRVRRFLDAAQVPAQHAFVGRQDELTLLAGVADNCLRSGHGRVVLIRGEAGIGKSRLADRFGALAREHGLETHRALVLDFGAGSGGDAMRQLARSLLGLPEGATAQALDDAVGHACATDRIGEDDVPFARELFELPQAPEQANTLAAMDAASRQRGLQRLMVTLASRRSAMRALVVVVEDVHWAERAVLDCLAHLAAATRSHPFILVLTARPEHDPLDAADRQALQAAAVLGQRFGPAALRYLSGDPDYACERLVQAAMVRPEGEDFLFMHALIHEAVYASLLKSRRQGLHRRAAEWYRERSPALMAEHLDAAGDPEAPRACVEAARHEAAHFRGERALRLVERGLRLDCDEACRYALATLRGELALDLGMPTLSLDAFRQAQPLATDAARQARVWLGVASALRLLDRYDEALAALREAGQAAATLGQPERLAEIDSLRGNVLFPMGDMDGCLAAHQRALQHARAAGSVPGEARALGGLGDAYYQQGRMLTAHAHFAGCVELARAHGFIRIECANLPMVGAVELFRMRPDAAEASCHDALRLARRIGDLRNEMLACDVLASTAQLRGDWRQSEAQATQALALARRLGARRFESEVMARLGLAIGMQGRGTEGEALLEEALRLSRACGMRYAGPTVLGFLARVAGSPERQREALREGEAILAEGCVSHCHFDLLDAAIDVSLAAGRWQEAGRYADALAVYTAREPLPWSDFLIRRGRVLARAGQAQPGEAEAAPLRDGLSQLADEARAAGLNDALRAIEAALSSLSSLPSPLGRGAGGEGKR